MEDITDPDIAAQQAERSALREDYLRTLASLMNKSVKIKMHEKITICAKMKAFDPVSKNFLISDAKVPMGGVLPSALIRGSDIISVHFCV